jgi:Leucine-rich repeat (LRR) protein
MSRKKLIGIVAACIIVVIVVLVISLSGRGRLVTFPDPNLKTAIREALNKPSAPIHASELAGLANLMARDSGIEDLSGLQYCTRLTDLSLGSNQISDISPLANLTNLTEILLYSNQIEDISPLVDNPGLGEGDYVSLGNNPLSLDSINTYIPQLRATGMAVDY